MTTPDKNLDYQENTSVSDVHASVTREKDDPQSGLEPATISVFAICAVLLMIGGAYLGANGGFNSSSVIPGYAPDLPEGAGFGAVVDPREDWLKNGKKKFGTCAGCHMLNGLGKAGQYPPLVGSEWVTGGTERLAALILHGLSWSDFRQGTELLGRRDHASARRDLQLRRDCSGDVCTSAIPGAMRLALSPPKWSMLPATNSPHRACRIPMPRYRPPTRTFQAICLNGRGAPAAPADSHQPKPHQLTPHLPSSNFKNL